MNGRTPVGHIWHCGTEDIRCDGVLHTVCTCTCTYMPASSGEGGPPCDRLAGWLARLGCSREKIEQRNISVQINIMYGLAVVVGGRGSGGKRSSLAQRYLAST